jgi:ADP-L-glycero-D-manno-heptose 6-epimerase
MEIKTDKYIIVTGAAGFIGSCFLKELNSRRFEKLIVVDTLSNDERWKNLLGKVFVDVVPTAQIFDWLHEHQDEVSAIVHLGACTDTTEKNAEFLLENNFLFSKKLCEFSVRHGIRFLYASSAATYGDGSSGFEDSHEKLEELRPLNMYGYSKQLFDLWLKREDLLSWVTGLKYFNVFGPNENHKGRMASQITRMVPEVMKTGKIRLFQSDNPEYKDGEQKRDFIYVKDVVSITADLLCSNARGIFNVGSGEASSWNTLAQAVFHALGRPTNIEYIPMPDDLKGKYQYFTKADMTKTKEALKRDVCRFSLEESVFDYVNGYLLQDKRW